MSQIAETTVRRHAAPEGAITEPLDDALEPDGFTPRLLALLSNALVWRESHELRRRFDLGTNDWRVISATAMRPGISATEVTEFLGVNKAVVSKSVNVLVERGLLLLSDGPRGSRPMYLSAEGAEMHHLMLPISLGGQDVILDGVPVEQVEAFNATLREMLARLQRA